jgi:aminoglycoside phosphotransferase (APT) family kinase protein
LTGIDSQLASVLARRIDGCQGLLSCERLSAGASQETYRIRVTTHTGEKTLAMRRAPAGAEAPHSGYPGLATEAKLMRAARAAGVPEPDVLWVLLPEDGLGDGFIMEWLEGETLGARIVRLSRISPEQYVQATWQRYQALSTPQPMIDFSARWLLEHLPPMLEPTLVHNDFRNGNIMVSDAGVVAVLDWEIAHIGDPMRDLGWICTNSWRFGRSELPVGGFGSYADLFRGYERQSGKRVDPDHVKFWEIFGSFWWACSSLSMAQHYRTGPDKTVERPAIGRRSSECQVDCVNLLIPGPVTLIAPEAFPSNLEMPRLDELVASVRDYLSDDVMPATNGRTRFLARVAGNTLDIVLRDLALGRRHRQRQLERLRALLGDMGDLEALRWLLVQRLRDNAIALDHPGLAETLREAVVNQVAIDQPNYSGLKRALANAAPGP